MPAERLAIAQVTPFAWEAQNEVNHHVERVSDELVRRGHRVLIVAPSESSALVRDSRRAIRSRPEELVEQAGEAPVVLGVGEVLPFSPARRRSSSLPVDVARTIEDALGALPLDVVHVHEPFAPSASSVALRHSRALNVGSFHAPTERVVSTQLTRGLVAPAVGAPRRPHRRAIASTRELMQRYFPGDYRVIAPGADVWRDAPRATGSRARDDRRGGASRAARCSCARCGRSPTSWTGTPPSGPRGRSRPRRRSAARCATA